MNLLLRDRERARRMGLEGRRFLSGDLYRRDFHLQALVSEYQAAIAQGPAQPGRAGIEAG